MLPGPAFFAFMQFSDALVRIWVRWNIGQVRWIYGSVRWNIERFVGF